MEARPAGNPEKAGITDVHTLKFLMGSDEYKIRMEGEYYYNKNNIVKLKRMLEKYHAGTLEFTPTCNIAILENQLQILIAYHNVLRNRAIIEKIETIINDGGI